MNVLPAMSCCLNPRCRNPINPKDVQVCQSCGEPLNPVLRGRYRAVQPIGQGGFGRTYLAADEDRLGTQCVIKQFSPQVQGTKSLDKAIALFNQEAVRLHELGEHPQIPTLLAYFEQDGYLYLVQQFIEGQNLLQEMRQNGAFSERQIREVLADVLPVLRFIHRHQVIHRDITPMNILRRQSDDRLILIDFGIAKQINEAASGEPGTRIGTEGYAPMEQFRGGRAFPASDIYSLGATCLHLVTEAKPDSLYDPLEGRWLWREYLQDRGVLVSDQFAHMMNMMLKDLVSERYQSADEVMRDLNADYFIPKANQARPTSGFNTRRSPTAQPSPAAEPAAPSRPPTSAPTPSRPAASRPPVSHPPVSRPPMAQGGMVASSMSDGRCIYTLSGHSSWVTTVAIAPDGSSFASGSLDDSIKLWSLPMGEVMTTLPGHRRGVNALVISSNGHTLTSGGDDYALKTWGLPRGELIRTLTGHSRDVSAVALSPDGQLLASGAEDRTIRLWHMGTGNLIKTILGVGSMVRCLAITGDGRSLISGGYDGQIKLWSLQTADQQQAINAHLNTVNAVLVSPDHTTIISAGKDKTIKLWELQSGKLLNTLTDHTRDVNALAITPDGRTLISGSSDTTIKFWSLKTGQVIETLSDHQDSVNTLAVSPDGKVLISGSSDKTIKVWRV